jgi:hypothetical protein
MHEKRPAKSSENDRTKHAPFVHANDGVLPCITACGTHETATVSFQAASKVPTDQTAFILQQIRNQVIARIRELPNALSATRTVTLQLSPQLLADTHVHFALHDAQLAIQFASKNHASFDFLQANYVDLQAYLQTELTHYKSIKVSVQSQLSQPHDGRSRNRFDARHREESAANA